MNRTIALATIALHGMPGGLERNIVFLANYLAECRIDVHLLSFDLPGAVSFYPLDPGVTWHRLGATRPHQSIGFRDRLRLLARMRKILVQGPGFDQVVCFHHGLLVRYFLATLLSRVSIVCSERNSLQLYQYVKRRRWNLNFLMLFLVKRITVQFPSYREDYPALLRRKIVVAHNPVLPHQRVSAAPREKIILSVGRYSAQKRFDLLIRACHQAFQRYPDWRLIIVGDGPGTSQLTGLVDELGMDGQVELVAPVKDLGPWYEMATFYCQASQWEGFPNAQAEAMAAGAIPLGFAETKGVADLIEPGVSGYLCAGRPSAEGLAATIIQAISDEAGRDDMSRAAREVSSAYSVESWQRCWRQVLDL